MYNMLPNKIDNCYTMNEIQRLFVTTWYFERLHSPLFQLYSTFPFTRMISYEIKIKLVNKPLLYLAIFANCS